MQQLNKTIQINIIAHVLLEERFLKFTTEDKTKKKAVIYFGHSLEAMQESWPR